MSGTSAVYTFKGATGQSDLHFVYHCDGYPRHAIEKIADLAPLAARIWGGEAIDLAAVTLPSIKGVVLRKDLTESKPPTDFRYEIQVRDGQIVEIMASRHNPLISADLTARLEAAEAALRAVKKEMREAYEVPTYAEIARGNMEAIRKLGFGTID